MLPSLSRTILTVRVTTPIVLAAVVRLDLDTLRHLPTVVRHADEAALAVRIGADPVAAAVAAPGGVARFTIGGVRAAPGVALAPARAVGGRLRRR